MLTDEFKNSALNQLENMKSEELVQILGQVGSEQVIDKHSESNILEDVQLFKEVIEEMGFELDNTPGGITINGIPATEYLETHNLFEF